MLSREFESWYNAFFRNDPNHNGIYNGMNLAGLDIARLYLALHKNPSLTIPEFLGREETFYKVTVPKSRHFDLAKTLFVDAHYRGSKRKILLGNLIRTVRCATSHRIER